MGKISAFIIADDVTGACDAAVAFGLRGLKTAVLCRDVSWQSGYNVVAISTETRDHVGDMRQRLREAAKRLEHDSPAIAMKKIDSMFRGNSFEEIRWWTRSLPGRMAVLAPAFPSVGRIVRDGTLRAGDQTLDLKRALQSCRIDYQWISSAHAASEKFRKTATDRKKLLLFDAESNRDLEEIVEAVDSSCHNVLWFGSGGLASALAMRLPFGTARYQRPERAGSVVFCIGSDHAVSSRQIELLKKEAKVVELHASRDLDSLKREVDGARDVLLRIPYGYDDPIRLRNALQESLRSMIAAFILSGGSTAATVCNALETEAIDIGGEVLPGIPWGALRGGIAHGVPVITKSGGFGEADALLVAASFFRAVKKEIDVCN